MSVIRLYTLVAVHSKTGKQTPFNLRPMTHHQACTMKSKFSYHPLRHIEVKEVAS